MAKQPLHRRTFLRGLGTAVAIPTLDAMLPSIGYAAEKQKEIAAPVRMAFIFLPNGMHMPSWTPEKEGNDFDLSPTLESLKSVRSEISVLSGLTHDKGRANGDGAGDHARAAASYLTGMQPKKTHGADIRAGVSVDQLAAKFIGNNTPLPSLELGCERGAQSGNCDSGYSCAYSSNISWRSKSSPMGKDTDPRTVFDRLFPNISNPELAKKSNRYKQSILDYVLEDTKSLSNKLGPSDLKKLDEYLYAIREVERRIQRAEKFVTESPDFSRPNGTPKKYEEHIRLMYDLITLAFSADVTRIATFMPANAGNNRSYKDLGVPEGHHDLSHHGNNEDKLAKIAKINKFHAEQFAYFLKKLHAHKDGDQSTLHNSMIVFGSSISDGNRHNHDELPIVLAGSGGGTVKTNRHVRFAKDTPMNNLFLSMMDRMQVNPETFGDSTARLEDL